MGPVTVGRNTAAAPQYHHHGLCVSTAAGAAKILLLLVACGPPRLGATGALLDEAPWMILMGSFHVMKTCSTHWQRLEEADIPEHCRERNTERTFPRTQSVKETTFPEKGAAAFHGGQDEILHQLVAIMVEGFCGASRRCAPPSMQISSPPLPSPGRSSPRLPWLVGGVPSLMGPVVMVALWPPRSIIMHGLCLNNIV